MERHTLFGAFALLFASGAMAQTPEITAYYLSGSDAPANTPGYYASLENLETLSNQVASQKSNFNKLVLSFVQPSLVNYSQYDLACTGLFGYICDTTTQKNLADNNKSTADFARLRDIINAFKVNGVETYIAVGGWNFSCIPEYYDVTAGKVDACGPAGEQYDSFPNPGTRNRFDNPISGQAADQAYRNVVQLASDLGVAGIDLDYEEFWHADLNAYSWRLTPDSVQPPTGNVEYLDTATLMSRGKGVRVYNDSMQLNPAEQPYPRIMPDTVDKFAAIMRSLYQAIDAINPELALSTAAPATGGIPNMSANWGSNAHTSNTYGGAWWGGNLYGLIYNTALQYPDLVDRLSTIGIMSYDLSETDCGGDTNIPCDLAGQVDYYYGAFFSWLKSGDTIRPGHAVIKGSPSYASASIQPQKLLISPAITVGFEVGRPATGNLLLSKALLTDIATRTARYSPSGMIMWDLYKDKRHDEPIGGWDPAWARPNDVLTATCNIMGLKGEQYDCASTVPTP
ncbi:glycosyl hydrolase family 18 protein [Aeromonas piscicola]|uniref:Glycosyl hydrolase family 18 protein n=1 Tax=Aeromonas piscicola TaxID=600645 RepID=A0ABT7QDA3_9GAMM|nr:glycosyl hydrolase family 18 protein [Aeromonas piscicola]MDM5131922.1 glycosyl hydrolase family 18 protein [Aeromonas piscicola]